MPVICPKCSHVRPADAANPDWQCPACGICYAKFGAPEPVKPVRPVQNTVEIKQGRESGMLLKIVLVVAVGWGINYAIKHRQHAPQADQAVALEQQGTDAESRSDSSAGLAAANAALRVSNADSSMLHGLGGRLERVCVRNKYGLSEQACLTRLRERQDGCATRTEQRLPGRMADGARMQVVVNAYMACIFEEDGPV